MSEDIYNLKVWVCRSYCLDIYGVTKKHCGLSDFKYIGFNMAQILYILVTIWDKFMIAKWR